jgi:MoaE-MoaD fusion protein
MKTICKISTEAIALDKVISGMTSTNTGAVATFTGLVRGKTGRTVPHETIKLEYEAYVPMAEKTMFQIADEIRSRWNKIEAITMIQRVGTLYPGDIAVVIACSASHRDTGVFEAARFGIERLKEIVPVWKKEFGPGGETWVEGEHFTPSQN